MANRLQEFLEKIRSLNGLRNAILCGITLSKREMTAEFLLVTDRAYSTMDEASAREICEAADAQGETIIEKPVSLALNDFINGDYVLVEPEEIRNL